MLPFSHFCICLHTISFIGYTLTLFLRAEIYTTNIKIKFTYGICEKNEGKSDEKNEIDGICH
jgi:hypothetical protein